MSTYDSKRRSEAAKKAWETKRANKAKLELELKDYGVTQPLPPTQKIEGRDYGTELPVTRHPLAGGIAEWDDPVFTEDPAVYTKFVESAPTNMAITKLGKRAAALDWVIVGEGPRAEALQEIIDNSLCWDEYVQWMVWALLEGVRFIQMKPAASPEGTGLNGQPWIVPDFFMGGRRKEKAGGTIQWDGHRIVEVQQTTGLEARPAKELPYDEFIIFRPGGGSSPEGDHFLARCLLPVADDWLNARRNTREYMNLFGIPARVLRKKLDEITPDKVTTALQTALNKIKDQQFQNAVALSMDEEYNLMEPRGQGFADMITYLRYLEGVANQLIVLNTLTSDTAESGPAGSSGVHLSEEDKAILIIAIALAESFNRYGLPWIHKRNPHIPALQEGETEPYLWPQPHGMRGGDNKMTDESQITGDTKEETDPLKRATNKAPIRKSEEVEKSVPEPEPAAV